jgi:NAD(P)-dependent dehydrogenase (short-subunit alcohol dehydrogenase family)
MMELAWRGKRLRMRPGKGPFQGVACSPETKPAPSGAGRTPSTKPAETLAGRGGPAYTGIGIGESKRKFWLKRIGKPEDVDNTALFLASEEGSFFGGSILHPDGGVVMEITSSARQLKAETRGDHDDSVDH